jgi:hypothetical protein
MPVTHSSGKIAGNPAAIHMSEKSPIRLSGPALGSRRQAPGIKPGAEAEP